MRKIKHSKYKNTGMLFELLARQITSEIISGRENTSTLILKKFFGKNTELFKEYGLYKTLAEEKFSSETKANMLIDAVLKSRKRLDAAKLKEEKYQLIKAITESFDLNAFFQTKVQNYKLLASIYKLFEYSPFDNPTEITRSKITILENLVGDSKKILDENVDSISHEPKEIRLLSYKILVEKFNQKYGDLNTSQKALLREYIGNVSNTNNLAYYIKNEAVRIKETLLQKTSRVSDPTLRIKLTEVVGLLDQYETLKHVDETHVSALMRYYNLVQDL